ncbi:MAG TPA: redoxin domain-containing protein [Sedimentisphaerales bacterium]|nr:redoxin domain-containing protein [Sedimentisphaerales bacterium]
MKTMSPLLRLSAGIVLCALLVLISPGRISAEQPEAFSAEELVERIIASEGKIRDVRAEYVFFEPETNKPLLYAEWGYEGAKEFIAGIWFGRAEDNHGYKISHKAKHALDENGTYYYFGDESESGRTGGSITPLSIVVSDLFRANMTPNSLLGFDVTCGIRQTFGEALKSARRLEVRREPEKIDSRSCLVLEALGIADAEFIWDVRAWIDTGRDLRPLRVEIFYGGADNKRFKRIFRRIYDIKLRDVDGIWFPIEGKRDTFTTKWGYFQLLRVPTRKLMVDFDSVRINRGVPMEAFKIEFPPGSKVWDEVRNTQYTVEGHAAGDVKGPVSVELSGLKRFAPPELMQVIYPDTLVGGRLPELADLQIKIDPDELKDKMILVCFWDMNQRPSRRVVKDLAKRAEGLIEQGVVTIATEASPLEPNALAEWVKENNIAFPVGMVASGQNKTRLNWGVKSLPWLILTDREHIVRAEGFSLEELDERIKVIESGLTESGRRDGPEGAEVGASDANAADLVRAVRENENWVHEVDSLYIRIDGKWTRTAEGIAARRAELRQYFPDSNLDPNRFTDLKPTSTETVEMYFDRQRLRFLRDQHGESCTLRIWDGNQAVSHENYMRSRQEGYYLGPEPSRIFGDMSSEFSWLRSQPHSFWWCPRDVEVEMKYFGRAEDFVITGRGDYRGIDCYVLEWDRGQVQDLAPGLSYRWYVGAKDRRIRGHVWLSRKKPHIEHFTLDYKEVAPGCRFPMTQGYDIYEADPNGRTYLKAHRDLKVIEVRVNEKLPDESFHIELKDGVNVVDERFGELRTYIYESEPTRLVGKALPDFEGIDIDFEPARAQGKAVLVCFFDMNQRPSRHMVRELAKRAGELEEKNVVVAAVQVSGVDPDSLHEWARRCNIPFVVGVIEEDEGKVRNEWDVRSLPWLVLADRQHVVAAEGFGIEELNEKSEALTSDEEVLRGRVTDPTGRPIANAEVQIRGDSTAVYVSETHANTETNEQGYYRFTQTEIKGPCRIGFLWREEPASGEGMRHQYVRLRRVYEGTETVDFQFQSFPEGTAGVRGQAVDQHGEPVKDFRLDIRNRVDWKDYSRDLHQYGRKQTLNTTDGRFRVDSLPAGLYRVSIYPEQALYEANFVEVTLEGGEVTDITPQLRQKPVVKKETYYGRVLYNDGTPAVHEPPPWPGARTFVSFGHPAGSDITFKVDDEGYFTACLTDEQIEQVKAGKARLDIFCPSYEDEHTSHPVGRFPAELLSRQKNEAGAVTIFKPTHQPNIDLPKAPSLVGKPLPELANFKIELSPGDVNNRMVLVCFLDMNQRPSRHLAAQLAEKSKAIKQKGVTVVGVQASRVDGRELDDCVKKYNITFPVGVIEGDEEKTRFNWGVKSLPWLILTDREHIIRAEGFGIGELDEKAGGLSNAKP